MKIVYEPASILRKKPEKVKKFDKHVRAIINEMKKIMVQNNGVGLSANQVGLDMAICIARPKEKFYVFINPELKLLEKEEIKEEGCLSIPSLWGIVKRTTKIRVMYQNLEGKNRKLTTDGFLAHILQHECDHLNGILFTDKASETYSLTNQEEDVRKTFDKKEKTHRQPRL